MRGFGFREHGGPDRLEVFELPEPAPAPGCVRIRLRSAAFNRLDRFVLEGLPGVPIERPHVLGSDGAGVVDALGAGVDDLAIGAPVLLNPALWDASCPACTAGHEELCRAFRIVGEHTQGTLTELIVLPRRNLHPKPARLSFAEAAAAPLVGQTAWRALITVGALAPGERVAIVGAGGGVATAAIQIAKARGAVVAVLGRSEAKLERARALGADAALPLPEDGSLDRVLWQWSEKRGVDVLLDSVGRATLPQSVRALARGGRLVVVGATTGPLVEIDLRPLFWRQASVRGSTMANRAEFEALYAALAAGTLRPVVDAEFPFAEARAAFDRFASGATFGKVVVNLP
jgi:NADPH:quinone reductase-like Zn-dependent oxidoreductase